MKATLAVVAFLISGIGYSVTAGTVTIPVSAQTVTASGFDHFNAHRQQDGITLAWTYDSPDVITFTIQHSYDGFSFTNIDQVVPSATGRNKYHQDDALPGYNYYRIVALLPNGQEYSTVECVRIVKRK